MAQKVQVLLVDDVDGGDAAETVTFALDGVSYEIDLSKPNADRLRQELSSWVGHARRAGGRKTASTSRRGSTGPAKRNDLSVVREWARNHGHKVSDRGRISSEVQAAYDAAHAD
ncbi:MAG TPA: Lsr2 family protein [Dermatophilaceae bacterium]|nr:Lsr2 family protein [Dermatophilaceae bacterium]